MVQLKFLGEKALNIWKKKHKGKEFSIKVTPVKANKQNLEDSFSEDSQSMDIYTTRDKFQRWPILEVAVSFLDFLCVIYLIGSFEETYCVYPRFYRVAHKDPA